MFTGNFYRGQLSHILFTNWNMFMVNYYRDELPNTLFKKCNDIKPDNEELK